MAAKLSPRSLSQEELVAAACQLIEESGAEGLSMRSLATRVGMSTMGLYTYFASKDLLLSAMVKDFRSHYDVRSIPGEPWDQTARRLCRSVRQTCMEHPELYRLCHYQSAIDTDFAEATVQIHRAQGMPMEAIEALWATAEAFIAGFVQHELNVTRHAEMKQNPLVVADTAFSKTPFDDAGFERGLDLIIAGLRLEYADQEKRWITPQA